MFSFTNKIVVITGATSGIGAATALKFAFDGANVVLVGRNIERGMALAKSIKENGYEAEFYRCDISVSDQINEFASFLENKYGRVDVLFNNAGFMPVTNEIENTSFDEWQKTFDININGVFLITRSLKSLLLKCNGCIINNASIAGSHSYVIGRSYAYSASKSAVIQFSRQMAKNYGEEGIRVNCICPGIIDTPILGDRDRSIYAERIPLGYVGKPDDVAGVVEFLASEAASYITGAIIPVDGGASL